MPLFREKEALLIIKQDYRREQGLSPARAGCLVTVLATVKCSGQMTVGQCILPTGL